MIIDHLQKLKLERVKWVIEIQIFNWNHMINLTDFPETFSDFNNVLVQDFKRPDRRNGYLIDL